MHHHACPLTIDFEVIVNAERAPCARSGEARRYEYPLAEDNDLNREIALFILTEAGAKVTCADDGFKALGAFEQADAGTFDFLILMDIMMPNMNGYEATRAIRSLSREDARTIPIVAMSANAFTEDKVRCREAGMDGHLTKPIDSDKLIDALCEDHGGEGGVGNAIRGRCRRLIGRMPSDMRVAQHASWKQGLDLRFCEKTARIAVRRRFCDPGRCSYREGARCAIRRRREAGLRPSERSAAVSRIT